MCRILYPSSKDVERIKHIAYPVCRPADSPDVEIPYSESLHINTTPRRRVCFKDFGGNFYLSTSGAGRSERTGMALSVSSWSQRS